MVTAGAGTARAADDKAWFGFAVSVETEGVSFNPTLRSVRIEKLASSSPAERAGVAPGDAVVSLDGIVVAGAKANELKAVMKKSVGGTVRIEIERADAEAHEVELVATTEPPGS